MHTRQQLLPARQPLIQHLEQTLPVAIFSRLRFGRNWITHGNRRTLQLLEFWDRHQNALLPKAHFKYCVAYDPLQLNPGAGPRDNGYFHAWLTTIRIYRDRSDILAQLHHDIRSLNLPGFSPDISDRAISLGRTFVWPDNPAGLVNVIGDSLSALIGGLHPLLTPLVDHLAAGGEADATRADRPRPAGPVRPDLVRHYTRSIPPSWRKAILQNQQHRCAQCQADLHNTGHHIDHIVPFSRGGTSDRANLQALCPSCNLRKGAAMT